MPGTPRRTARKRARAGLPPLPPKGLLDPEDLDPEDPPGTVPPEKVRTQEPYLTPEVQERICRYLGAGSHLDTAAAACGIARRTLNQWLQFGREAEDEDRESIYRDFAAAVEVAMAKAEQRLVALIAAASSEDWHAALQLLSRRYPQRWSETQKHEVTGAEGGPLALRAVSDDDLDERIASAQRVLAAAGEPILRLVAPGEAGASGRPDGTGEEGGE